MVELRGGGGKAPQGLLKVRSGRKRSASEAAAPVAPPPQKPGSVGAQLETDASTQIADRVMADVIVQRQNRESARDEVERVWARLDQIDVQDDQGEPDVYWRLGASDDPDMRVSPQTLVAQLAITAGTAGAVWLLAFFLTN